jgi:hypothetical protein
VAAPVSGPSSVPGSPTVPAGTALRAWLTVPPDLRDRLPHGDQG